MTMPPKVLSHTFGGMSKSNIGSYGRKFISVGTSNKYFLPAELLTDQQTTESLYKPDAESP
jgi:hypothetical protein